LLSLPGDPLEELQDAIPDLFDGLTAQEVADLVLSNIVTVRVTGAADNADMLAGTQLDQPGQPGVYTIWLASTQLDTLVTISLGGQQITTATPVVLRAGPEIRENEDPFFQMVSITGGRPLINVNVQTAATFVVQIKFIPAGAL